MALVATISTLRLRSAVRETAKAYGLDDADDRTPGAPLLPEDWHPDPRRRDTPDPGRLRWTKLDESRSCMPSCARPSSLITPA